MKNAFDASLRHLSIQESECYLILLSVLHPRTLHDVYYEIYITKFRNDSTAFWTLVVFSTLFWIKSRDTTAIKSSVIYFIYLLPFFKIFRTFFWIFAVLRKITFYEFAESKIFSCNLIEFPLIIGKMIIFSIGIWGDQII